MKKKNPHMLIGLCGCMMQEPEVVEKLKKSYRFVDLIFGTHNIFKFAELIYTRLISERMVIDIWKDTDADCRGASGGAKISVQIRCQYYVWLQQFLQLLYRSICAEDVREAVSRRISFVRSKNWLQMALWK